jgi:hypothetical protein
VKASLSDFDRFKVMVARKTVSFQIVVASSLTTSSILHGDPRLFPPHPLHLKFLPAVDVQSPITTVGYHGNHTKSFPATCVLKYANFQTRESSFSCTENSWRTNDHQCSTAQFYFQLRTQDMLVSDITDALQRARAVNKVLKTMKKK